MMTHSNAGIDVQLRKLPYPYRAALVLCSDIDDTRTTADFIEIQRYLTSHESTSMGPGLGLEVGNSFYFHDDDGYFSYLTGDDRAKGITEDLIHAGYIDAIHSFGDTAHTREQAASALESLDEADCRLKVWINHNGAPSNISRKFEYLFPRTPVRGDTPDSPIYHTDLTLAYGIRYAWVGAVSRIVGQLSSDGRLKQLGGVLDTGYPLRSAINTGKEAAKIVLGERGDPRYRMQAENSLLAPLTMEDGGQLYEFSRYCNHPLGVPPGDTCHGLAYVISPAVINRLIRNEGISIVYTHFGQKGESEQLIPAGTQHALRYLSDMNRDGQVFVTTTARLLQYLTAAEHLAFSVEAGDHTIIRLEQINDPIFGPEPLTLDNGQGLTFFVPDPEKAELWIGGKPLEGIRRNPPDHTGRGSISIPWQALEFPPDLH